MMNFYLRWVIYMNVVGEFSMDYYSYFIFLILVTDGLIYLIVAVLLSSLSQLPPADFSIHLRSRSLWGGEKIILLNQATFIISFVYFSTRYLACFAMFGFSLIVIVSYMSTMLCDGVYYDIVRVYILICRCCYEKFLVIFLNFQLFCLRCDNLSFQTWEFQDMYRDPIFLSQLFHVPFQCIIMSSSSSSDLFFYCTEIANICSL